MGEDILWALGVVVAALLAVWAVDRLLCRFYGWQDRLREKRGVLSKLERELLATLYGHPDIAYALGKVESENEMSHFDDATNG